MKPEVKPDCRHYRGDKPCGLREDCADCPEHEPLGPRILIIKLGALGDVLRTTPLVRGLAEQAAGAEIVWLTSPASAPLLRDNPYIHQLWITGSASLARLQVERFERVICLDKDPEAAACASLAAAPLKQGFGLSDKGRLIVLNQGALESLRLGLSDELKFHRNEKTYQRLMFEAAELEYREDYDYVFPIPPQEQAWVDHFLGHRLEAQARLVIGFNLGGGDIFAHKRWKERHFLRLRRLIETKWGDRAGVLALGGPEDADRLVRLTAAAPGVIDTGGHNSLARFAAFLKRCQVVITGDSLAMHLALAVGTWCLVLIGSTTWREIELYGRGEMIVSEMECSPCYKASCDREPDCMESLTPEMVMERLERLVDKGGFLKAEPSS